MPSDDEPMNASIVYTRASSLETLSEAGERGNTFKKDQEKAIEAGKRSKQPLGPLFRSRTYVGPRSRTLAQSAALATESSRSVKENPFANPTPEGLALTTTTSTRPNKQHKMDDLWNNDGPFGFDDFSMLPPVHASGKSSYLLHLGR